MVILYFFLLLILVKDLTIGAIDQKKTWDYTIMEMYTNSSNEDAYKWNLSVERIGRGQYAFSGTMDVKVTVDDTFYTEVKAYRSASGSNQYKTLPFGLPKQSTLEFMATIYNNLLMKSFKNCSNLPQSIDGKPPVLEIKSYTLKGCLISTEKLPSHMQNGFYKVHLFGISPVVNYFIEIIVEIETKLKI